ncbi:hypothetical protein PISMIDRAFT_408281 [Pisolithus microcarpus 441]|uniref:Unplaced genomic scaffold scaffold_32, whole genome shotgun sequence n=1 Tax=Pisolithus microcarpus 441 TaxID=765257 RepID=A0A0C9YHD7_9AGAM|nr:hypothetical protein PISMIDRAFT_408281 [Pisolithus microcarpus 441]
MERRPVKPVDITGRDSAEVAGCDYHLVVGRAGSTNRSIPTDQVLRNTIRYMIIVALWAHSRGRNECHIRL